MQLFFIMLISALAAVTSATISGPFLFWGHKKVLNLQPSALVAASEEDFTSLYRNAQSIVIFVRNQTCRLNDEKYPKFQQLVKENAWSYLPQRELAVEPFNFNDNIEIINLSGSAIDEDIELIKGYKTAVAVHGAGKVLGILANPDDLVHFFRKRRAAKDKAVDEEEEEKIRTTTAQTPTADENDESFIYVADGFKAILYVNAAPVLNISKESLKLLQHKKAITFDDQKSKGYGRLNIIFSVEGEKVFLRFNFTLMHGSWSMKAVEAEYKEYKAVLPIVGTAYDAPSAPLGFSYRCSARQMFFSNGNDSLTLTDYQLQPWLNGATKFGDVYDCIGFTTAPILAGILVSFFLCGILSIGLIALLEIKTPNRFESTRSKQLTINTQD